LGERTRRQEIGESPELVCFLTVGRHGEGAVELVDLEAAKQMF
jgi:hypothetical protein